MLDKHFTVKTDAVANSKNVILWQDYRITVLGEQLFRIEKSESKKFRDKPTQTVWFRNLDCVEFSCEKTNDLLTVKTNKATLIIKPKREDCRIEINGQVLPINNDGNLKGTYSTLDRYDGKRFFLKENEILVDSGKDIALEDGVCSRSGVAVICDEKALSLKSNGGVLDERGDGLDEYVFAFGNDYKGAVKALYKITGEVPLIPKFALGNWWSRYHVYTDKEYLALLNEFEESEIPLTVATIDMDWHYSNEEEIDEKFGVTKLNRRSLYYTGYPNLTWTGYSWNKRLFPDYKSFLKKISEKNLKITLNLHPRDGIRYWEDVYGDMAKAMGVDEKSGQHIPFDCTNEKFINAYFSIMHKPYEEDGVSFWWIDWQQGDKSAIEGLNPLWALNHYHYLDNAKNHKTPLILSRYAGIGSHRYPLGFSGDTVISWKTLNYLPEFTATASNIGFTWWSHDIGGHMRGIKDNELYVRMVQFGVFSPINRLHCGSEVVLNKAPWFYGNGSGQIASEFLRLRHKMIPFLYSSAYRTHSKGLALVEPLYYEHDTPNAYNFPNEYFFGGQLLVAPITSKGNKEGYASVKVWLPKGKWTDIFTKEQYVVRKGGVVKTLQRSLDTIPVLAKEGAIIPLSKDKGNQIDNPTNLQVKVYSGKGEYSFYEDDKESGNDNACFTLFKTTCAKSGKEKTQTLYVKATGKGCVIPNNRRIEVRFEDIYSGNVKIFEGRKELLNKEVFTNCVAVEFDFNFDKEYKIVVKYTPKTKMEEILRHAQQVLTNAEMDNIKKFAVWDRLLLAKDKKEYVNFVNESNLTKCIKRKLKETL